MMRCLNLVFFVFLSLYSLVVKAQAEIDSLEGLLNDPPTQDTVRVNLLLDLAQKFVDSNKDLFFKTVNEAVKISSEINYTKGQAEGHRLSSGYYLRRGAYDSALIHSEKAYDLSDAMGDKRGLAIANRTFAIYYMLTDNYSKALDYSFRAIDQFEAIGDKENLSKTLNNVAGIFVILEEYDRALEYYGKASEIENKLGNQFIMASILANIGDIQIARGQFDQATEKLRQALLIAEEIKNPPLTTYVTTSLAKSLFRQGDNDNAKAYHEQSLAMTRKYGFNDLEIDNLIGLAEIYLDEREFSQAKDNLEAGLSLVQELGSLSRLNQVYKTMADLHRAMGNYKKAYEFLEKHKHASDSLFSEKNIVELTNLENQYEFEKEKEAIAAEQTKKDAVQQAAIEQQTQLRNIFIAGSSVLFILSLVAFRNLILKRKANKLLTIQKEEIQKQSEALAAINHQLEESNAAKDKFFRIISHDLRGPFSTIIGLSQLLLSTHTEFDQQQREEIIRRLVQSSTNANNLLENLLKWSMSQTGSLSFQPSQLSTQSIISNSMSLVGSAAADKKIELIDASKTDSEIHADKEQIETVLRNLISNSIKFTNENGAITVRSDQNSDETIFSVEDTGIGMEQGKIEKLFDVTEKISTLGTNKEVGTGLGLILCKEFVEMHKGRIWFESVLGKGSKFHFSIPKEMSAG